MDLGGHWTQSSNFLNSPKTSPQRAMNPSSRVNLDKISSVCLPYHFQKPVDLVPIHRPQVGHLAVVRVKTLIDRKVFLELPCGRSDCLRENEVLVGVLGRRRALFGLNGDIPVKLAPGDDLHLLNMGGVLGLVNRNGSESLPPVELSFLGGISHDDGTPMQLRPAVISSESLNSSSTIPVIAVAGTSMNAGKTQVATSLIESYSQAGKKVAAAKLTGVARLRDLRSMKKHGATICLSFHNYGFPSTVDLDDVAPLAKALINKLSEHNPDIIVLELGDGILGGYHVDTFFYDNDIKAACASLVFCASDFVGAWGGIHWLQQRHIPVTVLSGSVTDAPQSRNYIHKTLGVETANAKAQKQALYNIVNREVNQWLNQLAS